MTMLPPDPLFVAHSNAGLTTLLLSDDSRYFFSGGLDGVVQKWCLKSYRPKSSFKPSQEGILSIQKVDECLLVQDKTGCLSLWRDSKGEWTSQWACQTDYVGFCRAKVLEDILVSPESSGKLLVFNAKEGRKISENMLWEEKKSGEIMAIEIFKKSSGYYVIISFENGCISLWRIADRILPDSNVSAAVNIPEMKNLSISHASVTRNRDDSDERCPISVPCTCSHKAPSSGDADLEAVGAVIQVEECAMALTFDPIRMRGVAGGPTETLTVFSVSLEGLKLVRDVKVPSKGVTCLSIRCDSRILAVGCSDGSLRLLSFKNFLPLAVLHTHDEAIQDVSHTLNSPYILAAACKEGRISLWNLYNKNA